MIGKMFGSAALLGVGAAALALLAPSEAGDKASVWQSILSKQNYQELVKREADLIHNLLAADPKDPDIRRARLGAVMIAAMAKSTNDLPADELHMTNSTAVGLADLLRKSDALAEAKSVAALLPNGKKDFGPAGNADSWRNYASKAELMEQFNVKSKGGDGLHPDLQSNVRLKGALNGVEEKIRALSLTKLSAAGLKKEAKELELLACRCGVVGELIYYYAPAAKVGTKDPADWRKYSLQTRDAGKNLAAAAVKGDIGAVLKSSNDLNSACSQCHAVFRE